MKSSKDCENETIRVLRNRVRVEAHQSIIESNQTQLIR